MSEVRVRAATPDDIAAITHLYANAVGHGTATFEIAAPDEAEMARRLQALLAKNYPYVVAESDGAIAGYAYAGPYHTRPGYHWSVEDSIYVAPDFHRRGLGRLLLARLITDAEVRVSGK